MTLTNGETSPVMFITYALDEARKWNEGRGFVYKVYRQADGTYGNEEFIEGPR